MTTNKKQLRVFISGATPFADNRGVAGIFRGILVFLKNSFPNDGLKLYVWHTHPESISRYKKCVQSSNFASENFDITILPTKQSIKSSSYLHLFTYVFNIFLLNLMLLFFKYTHIDKKNLNFPILKEILKSDIIIESSFGDLFTDVYYGPVEFLINLMRISLISSSNKPVYFFPQSIGPFRYQLSKILSRIVLNKAKLICVRDQKSMIHVLSLGIDKTKVIFVPDMAFLVPSISKSEAKRIIKSEGGSLSSPRDYICVFLNVLSLNFMQEHEKILLNKIALSLDQLIEKYNAFVIFIPHVTSVSTQFDCRELSILVKNIMKYKSSVVVIKNEYSVEQLWGIIRLCKLSISFLTHPVIASLRNNVPVVAIGYSHKTVGIMNFFNMRDYVLSSNHFTIAELNGKIAELYHKYENIKTNLLSCNEDINSLIKDFKL